MPPATPLTSLVLCASASSGRPSLYLIVGPLRAPRQEGSALQICGRVTKLLANFTEPYKKRALALKMDDAMELIGRHALVTGASSGLGRHFARLLARKGARVVVASRRPEPLEELVASLEREGGSAQALVMDVADERAVAEAIETLNRPIDILINNAGIAPSGKAATMPVEDWDSAVSTNLRGVFLVAQAVGAKLISEGEGGSIVNVASILGLRVASDLSAYAASKAGVVRLTEALALEWARYGIRVNALCPGYIETDLNREFFATDAGKALINRIPQRRLGKPEELDGALMLLASDLGSFMTGASLVVDGGHMVSSL